MATRTIEVEADTRGGTVRAAGISVESGSIVGIEAQVDTSDIWYFRRCDRWVAVLASDNTVLPGRLRFRVTVTEESASPRVSMMPDVWLSDLPGAAPDALCIPWQRLVALETWTLGAAADAAGLLDLSYFYALDCQVHPGILMERRNPTADPARLGGHIRMIKDATTSLLRRLASRQSGAEVEVFPEEILARLEPFMRSNLQALLPPAEGANIELLFYETFTRFGEGRYALIPGTPTAESILSRLSNGSPNSAFVFMFAEFAIAALESGSTRDRALWEAALPAFVACGESYLLAYDALMDPNIGKVVRRDFDAYANLLPSRKLSEVSKRELRLQYAAITENPALTPGERVEALKDRLRRILAGAFLPLPTVQNTPPLVHFANWIQTDFVERRAGEWKDLPTMTVHRQDWWI